MKLITTIVAAVMMTGGVCAQNPNIINNVQSKIDTVQQQKADGSDAALSVAGVPATTQATKPVAGTSAKSAAAPTAPAKSQATVAKPAPSAAVKPAVAAKPATPSATKPVVAIKSAAPTSAKPVAVKSAAVPAAKAKNTPGPATTAAKPHDAFLPKKPAKSPAVATVKPVVPPTKIAAAEKTDEAGKSAEAPKPPKPEEKKWAMNGKRDPFFSPVVQQTGGSGCSTGKKCLEIGQINVRGVVKSETGFIAVVTNSLNKAYFLHESDPVFNGYVLKITGDSVVFQETVQDKLGKPLTREVVKRIVTPAV
jgi:Tfp pilus assembly protein PilP